MRPAPRGYSSARLHDLKFTFTPAGADDSVHYAKKETRQKPCLFFGAGDEARTRYLHLGKVALYQMSYGRISGAFIPAPSRAILANFGAPAKACEARFCGEKEKVLHDFRCGASDRNRTNDTGIFSPLLYRLSYRGAPDDDYYT